MQALAGSRQNWSGFSRDALRLDWRGGACEPGKHDVGRRGTACVSSERVESLRRFLEHAREAVSGVIGGGNGGRRDAIANSVDGMEAMIRAFLAPGREVLPQAVRPLLHSPAHSTAGPVSAWR